MLSVEQIGHEIYSHYGRQPTKSEVEAYLRAYYADELFAIDPFRLAALIMSILSFIASVFFGFGGDNPKCPICGRRARTVDQNGGYVCPNGYRW